MAADKIVQSFLILFSVVCIVRNGFCAPIQEKVVLDNGTVLTVVHDVQAADPPRYESALDANNKDEAKPMVVIHEAQYAPPLQVISKRSADHDNDGEENLDIRIEAPKLPPPPHTESEKEPDEINTPGVVEAGVQTTKGVEKLDSDENKNNDNSETKKDSKLPKSEIKENDDAERPEGNAENEADDDGDGKGEKRTTPIALPTKSINKVDGSEDSDSKEGSKTQRDNKLDANDERATNGDGVEDNEQVTDGNDAEDQSDKNDGKLSVENSGKTPSGEGLNQKSSTEKNDIESNGESIDNKPSVEPKDENISRPSVSPPSDEDNDDELTSDQDDDDQQIDDKGNFNGNDDGKMNTEGEDGDYDDRDEDDTQRNHNAELDTTSDEGDEDEDDDDDGALDENYNKGKPSSSGEVNDSEGSSNLKKDISDESQSSGHFMSYFLIAVVFVACFYLVFHNRQKIKAYIVEGKTGRGRRRKAGDSEYRQLSTAEEVLPAVDKGLESKTTTYTY